MPAVDVVVETPVSRSVRARQVESLFDVPPGDKSRLAWSGDVPLHEQGWSVGLIVGPSGCGKTSVAKNLFGGAFHPELTWGAPSVVDDVSVECTVEQITKAFSSVGFNTIPAWLRPYRVLSNGEQFRVDLARRLLEIEGPIVVDEFTSVVDRQTAQIGSHAVQKHVRRSGQQFVAVSCHYDIIDWLQPDWILEPATMAFRWRSVRRRPKIKIEVAPVRYSAWELFAPYHYMSASLARSARCYCAFVDSQPVAFAGIMHFPHAKVRDIKRISRIVVLPDWQGIGLAFVLADTLGAAYRALGYRLRNYPAHPAYVRAIDRSPAWALKKRPGTYTRKQRDRNSSVKGFGGRPCAVFEYIGPPMNSAEAKLLCAVEG